MATSKVYQGFVPTLSTNYTDYITLEDGVTVNVFRLEQVDNNIWGWTFAGNISPAIPARTRKTIAHYDLTKLPAMTGHVAGFYASYDIVYPQNMFFNATGNIDIYNHGDVQADTFSANGLTYRRI